MNKVITFRVQVPTDNEYLGHACNSPNCGHYFKVHQDDRSDFMQCPYCGKEYPESELRTKEQVKHIKKAAEAETLFYAKTEIQKMLKGAFGGASGSREGWTYKHSPIHKEKVTPNYRERKVDSQLQCPDCNCRFQVYGLFGFCPRCGESNLNVYDTNWRIIEAEILKAESKERSLRHAYTDLVSAFEIFCNGKANRLGGDHRSFQVLNNTKQYFKKQLFLNIFDGLSPSEFLTLKRLFQKRHVYIHANGVITESFIKAIPEDRKLLGQKAELSLAELKMAAESMRVVIGNIITAIEEKG